MTPTFILGSGRSGTSVLLWGIAKTFDIPHHGEGHVTPLLAVLSKTIADYYDGWESTRANPGNLLHHVSPDDCRHELAHAVARILENAYGGPHFIDKTTGVLAIRAAPLLARVWPDMRVIYAKRRGIEFMRSAERKFTNATFELLCRTWTNVNAEWRKVRPALSCPVLEVDQFNLASDPIGTAREIAGFMGEPDRATALEDFFTSKRPQSSGDLNTKPVAIEATGWSSEQIAMFRAICGPEMAHMGYSETPSYWKRQVASAA